MWWQLPAILAWALTQQLKQQGLSDVSVVIEKIQPSQAKLSAIKFSYDQVNTPEPAARLDIVLGEIQLVYTLSGLLEGHVDKIQIDHGQLIVSADKQPSTSFSLPDLAPIIDVLNRDVINLFPVNELLVQTVDFTYKTASKQESVSLQLDIVKEIDQLKSEVRLGDGRQITWLARHNQGWTLLCRNSAEALDPALSINLAERNEQLYFKARIVPKLLQAWTAQFDLEPLDIDAPVVDLEGSAHSVSPNVIQINTLLETPYVSYQDVTLRQLVSRLVLQLTEQKGRIKLTLQPVSELVLQQFAYETWLLDKVSVKLNGGWLLSDQLEHELAMQAVVDIDQIKQLQEDTSEISFLAKPVALSVGLDHARLIQGELSAKGQLRIPFLSAAYDEQRIDLEKIVQDFELVGDILNVQGQFLNSLRDVNATTSLQHSLSTQAGKLQLTVPEIEFNQPGRLASLIQPVESPVVLVSGSVLPAFNIAWQHDGAQWSALVNTKTAINSLGGAYDDIYFSGLSGELAMQLYPQISSNKTQQLTVDYIDAGVANQNVVMQFKVLPSKDSLPVLRIKKAQTTLLEGIVKLTPMDYDLNSDKHAVELVLDKINLDELIRLQQLEGVEATGLMSGVLPIVIKQNQFSVDQGRLHALKPGGVIRYETDLEAMQANDYTNQLASVLRNFHYQVLSADTQYQPDGTLLLKLALQGNNPEFENGRAVNLNINLEQNILKLFESLRLVEGINDKLDQRVQKYYQQQSK